MILETLGDLSVIDLAVTDVMLARVTRTGLLDLELRTRHSALRALLRSFVSFIHIPADRANPSFHLYYPFLLELYEIKNTDIISHAHPHFNVRDRERRPGSDRGWTRGHPAAAPAVCVCPFREDRPS